MTIQSQDLSKPTLGFLDHVWTERMLETPDEVDILVLGPQSIINMRHDSRESPKKFPIRLLLHCFTHANVWAQKTLLFQYTNIVLELFIYLR